MLPPNDRTQGKIHIINESCPLEHFSRMGG